LDYKYRSGVLDRLGVRSWINARNWSTVIGGTWIDDRVLEAMNEVAKTFVDMHELFARADARVAELCQVEDAHITTGTGAALELAVAACMAGDDYGRWMRLPDTEGMRNEVLMPRGHVIAYTPQWTASGAKTVEYGQAGHLRSFKDELESLISDRTCCLAYTVSYNTVPRGVVPLEDLIELGERYDVPVVVDAASELPPVSNLHKYTDMGADIVCFSGGKAVKAPNNTGFMVGGGRGTDLIEAVRGHTFPHSGWGRGHKISKEQIVGLVIALEIFVEEGDSLYAGQMAMARRMAEELGSVPGLEVEVIPNDEKYHEHPSMPHVPRVLMKWSRDEMRMSAEELDAAVARDDPPVYLRNSFYYEYYTDKEWRLIDTYYLRPEEERIVVDRIVEAFRGG